MPENERIPAGLIVEALKEAFRAQRTAPPEAGKPLGWVLSVPDTHQRSTVAALEEDGDLRLLTCSTEDEANAIAAGLYIGGEEVALMIQHAGLYASVNTLRGVGLDGGVPLFALVGLLSREPELEPRDSPRSMVRFAGPLMDTFRRAARTAGDARRPGPHPGVLRTQPRAIGAGGRVRGAGDGLMRPEDVLRAINEARGEALVVPTMTTVPEWRTIAPDAPSVACVGFMGGASSLGLGLALAQPERRVIVLDGDGSLLMQLGSLATVAGRGAGELHARAVRERRVPDVREARRFPQRTERSTSRGWRRQRGTRSRRASRRWRSCASACRSY